MGKKVPDHLVHLFKYENAWYKIRTDEHRVVKRVWRSEIVRLSRGLGVAFRSIWTNPEWPPCNEAATVVSKFYGVP